MRARMLVTTLAATSVAASAAVPAAAAPRHGQQRNYAGASYYAGYKVQGWHAKLRVDKAVVRDNGWVSQTLWATTNRVSQRWGLGSPPYVQISITKTRKSPTMYLVASQRNTKGRYFEVTTKRDVANKREVPISMSGDPGKNRWGASEGGDFIGNFSNTGNDFLSSSVYAGVESSSTRNSLRGSVTELYRTVVNDSFASPFPCWTTAGERAKFVKRGPNARATWTKKYCSFKDAFGR